MLGQQMPNHAAATKWTFFGFFVVILMGFLLGFNIKDATWLNRDIASVEAERIAIDNAHQQAMYRLAEEKAAAQSDAEIREIKRQQDLLDAQYRHDIQALEQSLAHRERAFQTLMTVLAYIAIAFALVLVIIPTLWVAARAWVYIHANLSGETPAVKNAPREVIRIKNRAVRKPQDSAARQHSLYQKRIDERLREIEDERKKQQQPDILDLRMKRFSDPAKIGRDKYGRLSLAGD